ncbi:hypothetical protein K0038_05160 [Pseudomonas syringae]|nr:hypothetical protein [Pseudomonas syringae]MCI3948044.1 hypothetical protein [Pseudomonas syringae]
MLMDKGKAMILEMRGEPFDQAFAKATLPTLGRTFGACQEAGSCARWRCRKKSDLTALT